MKKEQTVSVILRTYNREKLLREALTSLVKQTYPKIELVVINDGGDDVSDVIDEFKQHFFHTIYYALSKNQGRAAAANCGLKRAAGHYILFLDDDDLILEEHISVLVQHLEHQSKYMAAYTGTEMESSNGNFVFSEPFNAAILRYRNFLPIHSVLFKREVLDYASFDLDFDVYEDWDFWLQIAAKSDFFHIKEYTTAIYRSLGNSDVGIVGSEKKQRKSQLKILKKWSKFWTAAQILDTFEGIENTKEEEVKNHIINNDNLNKVNTSLSHDNDSLNKVNSSLSHDNDSLNKVNSSLSHDNDNLNKVNSSLSHDNDNLNKVNSSLSHDNDNLNKVNSSLSHDNDNLNKVNSSLSHDNDNLNKVNSSLSHDNDNLNKVNSSLSHDNDNLNKVNSSLSHDNDNLNKVNISLSHDNDSLNKVNSSLSHDNDNLNKVNSSLSHDNDNLNKVNSSLSHDNDNLNKVNSSLSHDNDNLNKVNSSLSHDNDNLNKVNSSLSHDNDNLNEVNSSLNHDNDNLNNVNISLSRDNNDLNEINKQLNQSNMSINELLLEKEKDNLTLKSELAMIYQSISWKLTKPLRFVKQKLS